MNTSGLRGRLRRLDLLRLNINSLMQFRRPVGLHVAFGDHVGSDENWFAVTQPNRPGIP